MQGGEVRPPDILKIDVEGAGPAFLEGLGKVRPKDIFIEVHPLFGESREWIEEFLRARGYMGIWEQPRGDQVHVHFSL